MPSCSLGIAWKIVIRSLVLLDLAGIAMQAYGRCHIASLSFALPVYSCDLIHRALIVPRGGLFIAIVFAVSGPAAVRTNLHLDRKGFVTLLYAVRDVPGFYDDMTHEDSV